jgi:hypothetical protein
LPPIVKADLIEKKYLTGTQTACLPRLQRSVEAETSAKIQVEFNPATPNSLLRSNSGRLAARVPVNRLAIQFFSKNIPKNLKQMT